MTLFEREHYSVELQSGSDTIVMRGVLRLASPAAYEPVFAPVRATMDANNAATLDIRDVSFMNSSGIRALASLILSAKGSGVSLTMVVRDAIPWQRKTVARLQSINPALRVDVR
jgi:hypothetical protein